MKHITTQDEQLKAVVHQAKNTQRDDILQYVIKLTVPLLLAESIAAVIVILMLAAKLAKEVQL